MEQLIGKVPTLIEQSEHEIRMTFDDNTQAVWYHMQDCCESVVIEDVNGDWSDLIGHPLLVAEERVSTEEEFDENLWSDSNTWTFYTFRSIGGSVDVRWHGSSNGYYSESVNFSYHAKG